MSVEFGFRPNASDTSLPAPTNLPFGDAQPSSLSSFVLIFFIFKVRVRSNADFQSISTSGNCFISRGFSKGFGLARRTHGVPRGQWPCKRGTPCRNWLRALLRCAVSRNFFLRSLRTPANCQSDCQSATRQIPNLRYAPSLVVAPSIARPKPDKSLLSLVH